MEQELLMRREEVIRQIQGQPYMRSGQIQQWEHWQRRRGAAIVLTDGIHPPAAARK